MRGISWSWTCALTHLRTPEVFHFDNFELRDGKLYYREKSTPLMIKVGKLRLVGAIAEILGKERPS